MNKTQFTALVRTMLEEHRAGISATYRPKLLLICQRAHTELMERDVWLGAVDLAWLLWRRETWTASEDPFELAVRRVLDVAIAEALAKWCEGYDDLRGEDATPARPAEKGQE